MVSELFLTFVRRLIFAFLLIGMVASLQAHGQISGTVGIYTRQTSVFTAQATTASSAFFPDFGFACNALSYQTTAFTGTITLEWVPPGSSTAIVLKRASYFTSADTGNHVLQLGEYFPNLRSTVTPSGGSLNAQYTAISTGCPIASSGLGSNGDASPIVCDHNNVVAVSPGTVGEISGPINIGDTFVICGFMISFASAPSTGTVALGASSSSACSTYSIPWEMYTSAGTPVVVPILIQQTLIPSADYACFANNSGVSVFVSYSYASVHGL